jgi:hypothetical protein
MVDWEALHENVAMDLDGDFDKLWEQGTSQTNVRRTQILFVRHLPVSRPSVSLVQYMRFFIESSLKVEGKRNALYDFIDRALKHSTERQNHMIHNYAPELVMVCASRNDAPLGMMCACIIARWLVTL